MDRMSAPKDRLEALWAGDFGDAYTERNAEAGAGREPFWNSVMSAYDLHRVVEIGCNVGANLRWIAPRLAQGNTFGVDVNALALRQLRARLPDVNAMLAPAKDLPLRTGWFDLAFTTGVLIHQPDSTLATVMGEIVRVTRRYVLCGEYFATTTEEVPYRGQEGALFKRDYGALYLKLHPELRLVDTGFLGRSDGWDDITWWLFEK